MKFKNLAAASLLAFGTFALAMPAITQAASDTATLKKVDTDNDGTIDMAEAKTAAMSKFQMLDKDNDGTLDSKEAGMNVTKVDPDKDGTVDKTEFESALGATFKAADTDHDGTIDAKELGNAEGKKLEKMIK